MIQISAAALIFSAFLLLMLPFRWLAAAFLAAFFHEIAHLLILTMLGGKVYGIFIGLFGAVIDGFLPDKKSELFSILAGPLCSLSLCFFCRLYPQLAVCGMIQGLFNLLPILPLDGGRLLVRIAEPRTAEAVGICAVALIEICWIALCIHQGSVYDISLSILILLALLRNFPCKQKQIGVQ